MDSRQLAEDCLMTSGLTAYAPGCISPLTSNVVSLKKRTYSPSPRQSESTGLTSNPSRLPKPPARSKESICFISQLSTITTYETTTNPPTPPRDSFSPTGLEALGRYSLPSSLTPQFRLASSSRTQSLRRFLPNEFWNFKFRLSTSLNNFQRPQQIPPTKT